MKSYSIKLVTGLVIAGVVAGLILAYRARQKEVAADAADDQPIAAPTRVAMVNGENVVTLDAATRGGADVTLAPLPVIEHRPQVDAYGAVLDLGDLTELQNTVATAVAQEAKATAARDVARSEYDRTKALFAAGQNTSQKNLEQAEGALRTEQANVQSMQASLAAAKSSADERWGPVIAGWLRQGASELDRLLRRDDLLIQVTLAPDEVEASAPTEALVRLADGKIATAKLVSPAARTDPALQGRSFYFLLPAANSNLLPGMNISVSLPVGRAQPGVLVPTSAVVWLQGQAWAYAEIQPDKFARRAVSVAQATPAGWVQPPGFAQGQPFVIRGAQVLLSEEFRAQISVGD